MKTTKKIIAFAAALSLSACMMAMPMGTAWAAANNTITITDTNDGFAHTGYKAYQVFTGTYDPSANNNKGELTITNWGDGVDSAKLIAALKASTLLGTDFTSMTATGAEAAKIVAEKISAYGDKSAEANEFARIALRCAIANKAKSTSGKTISGLDDGYYVVADSAAANVKDGGSGEKGFALGMLVAGGAQMTVETTTKISFPTVVKKVEENHDVIGFGGMGETAANNNYNDVADYNIGDSVPFKLYGTMPSNLDAYPAYYYKFSDTLSKGLDLPEEIKVNVGNTTITFSKAEGSDTYSTTSDRNCRVAVASASDGRKTITVSFEDVKAYSGVSSSTVITVKYESILNENAVIGLDGNLNTVRLSYLNNPNMDYRPNINDNEKDGPRFDSSDNDGNPYNDPYSPPHSSNHSDNPNADTPDNPDTPTNSGGPGKPYNDTDKPDTPSTPDNNPQSPGPNSNEDSNNPYTSTSTDDKVIVFTYEIDVTKADALHHETKLSDVEFMLKKGGKYVKIDSSSGKVTGWADTKDAGSVLKTGNNGMIKVIGLDAGEYTIEETKTKAGYNDPGTKNTLTFTIDADTDNCQNWTTTADQVLKGLRVTRTDNDDFLLNDINTAGTDANNNVIKSKDGEKNNNKLTGAVAFEIYNTKGATLPSTGGIGTTIFLLTGGAAAGAAAVIYIARKRASASES